MMSYFGPPNVEKLKTKGDVKGLIKALNYPKDTDVRRAAAESLGQIGDPGAVEALIELLKEWGATAVLKAAAADALGRIGDARAVDPLVSMIVVEDKVIAEKVAGALVRFGKPAVAPLLETIKRDQYIHLYGAVVDVIGQIGAPAIEPLIAALNEPLCATQYTRNSYVHKAAAEALGKIGDARAIEPLIATLKKTWAHDEAANALDKIGWRPGQDENGATYWVVKRKWDKCIEIGAPAIEPLIAALKDDDRKIRPSVANSLGQIGAQLEDVALRNRIIESLRVALNEFYGNGSSYDIDEAWKVRNAAASALVKIGVSAEARNIEPSTQYMDRPG
jgi:HEAT repeat protein